MTAAITQLEYDGQGLLLRITENENVRHLVRDRADSLARPLVEMDAMTNAIRQFVWANGKLLAQVAGNGTIRVAHSDELGRILALTDANGVLTDEYAYQPYGRLIARSGTNDLPFAFMGDYGVWSAGNGLYLTRHRAYDSNLMRFLQPDPIGLEGGYNLYAYGAGNPVSSIDPYGLMTWSQVGYFAAGVVVGAGVAVGVVIAAPAVASAGAAILVAAGVPTTTAGTIATATVSGGLLVAGGYGAYTTGVNIHQNALAGNWDAVAFDAGTFVGGVAVGVGGRPSGGRVLAEGMMGRPSPAPNTWNPIRVVGYEWANRYQLSMGPPGAVYFATSPTPASGGAAAAGIAGGIGTFFYSSPPSASGK